MVDHGIYVSDIVDEGFEDCVYGGLRPNYKIPILLSDMKEETIDGILQSEENILSCASCSFRFIDFLEMKHHMDTCSGLPSGDHIQEYQISQYHTNALIVALKDMYAAGTRGLNPIKTETKLPFYMEPYAGLNIEHQNRILGNLAIVTCRMCKQEYIHRNRKTDARKSSIGTVLDDCEKYNPSLIRHHVPDCPEYNATYKIFMKAMDPFVKNVRYHYKKLFKVYKAIRGGIYGSRFKFKDPNNSISWHKMTTINEHDENPYDLMLYNQLRCFTVLHNIEPENVDFVRCHYFNSLNEVLDGMFFMRVTGL